MEVMEEKLKAFEERIQNRTETPRPEEKLQQPIQKEIEVIFKELLENKNKSILCKACNYINLMKSNPIVLAVSVPVFGENVVIPMFVCNRCGVTFMAASFREVIKKWQKKELEQAEHYKRTAESG